jgi:hypothetical protein
MIRQVGRYDEDQINETIFQVVPGPGGNFRPRLVSVTLKR